MNRRGMKIGVIQLLLLAALSPMPVQANADLVVQSDITPEYIAYLAGKEAGWLLQMAVGGDDTETMKAHMGLTLLAFAWSHVDGDTLTTDLDLVMENLEDNFVAFGDQLDLQIKPLFEQSEALGEFIEQLTDFFASGDYVAFRDSVENYFTTIDEDLIEIGDLLDDWGTTMDDNFSKENFDDHLDAVLEGTADFEFSVQIVGTRYEDEFFVFSRTFFDRTDALDNIGREMEDEFDRGGEWLDSVMTYTGGDVMPGIAFIRAGLDNMTSFIDTLKVVYTSDPLTPFDIDVSPLDSLRKTVVEIDTLLGGKVYDIGPDEEGKTIKPLAIIQSLPGDGMNDLLEGFYYSSDPTLYSFGGIFPEGPTTDVLDFIEADAVLNKMDDEDAFYAHLLDLKAAWLQDIQTDPEDPDAHMGVALVLLYEMARDHEDIFEDVFRLLEEGRIDSLTFYYDWDDVDLSDEISEIGDHVDFYVETDDFKHLNILIKTEPDSYGQYEIGPESQFEIAHVSVIGTRIMRDLITLAGDALGLIAGGLVSIFDEVSEIFIVDLDPSVLDFSQIDSDSALILMLEESNPDFLSLTPYGVEQFHSAGEDIEQGLEELADLFDKMTDLAYAMLPYEEDFQMDGNLFIEDMESASDITWELWEDFAYSDSVTMVDGERVNFSAWFDNPPESFLIMWKMFVFGTDSTLGGLFPDRPLSTGSSIPDLLPKNLVLYPNYPNPFNPLTRITFDLPEGGRTSLVIYSIRGEEVTRLISDNMEPGTKILYWNAHGLSSGVYICRLEHNGRFLSNKMMLIK